jgi:hypothetical protein
MSPAVNNHNGQKHSLVKTIGKIETGVKSTAEGSCLMKSLKNGKQNGQYDKQFFETIFTAPRYLCPNPRKCLIG